MILVTVGTDGPFDRLIATVDQWAAEAGRSDLFAQVGDSRYEPRHLPFVRFLDPVAFARHFEEASLVIAHAGMGTILTALQHQTPLLVMPRRAALGEQRNDHQLATARRLADLGKVRVAFDERELRQQLDRLDDLTASGSVGPYAQPGLIRAIREFIAGGAPGSVGSRT